MQEVLQLKWMDSYYTTDSFYNEVHYLLYHENQFNFNHFHYTTVLRASLCFALFPLLYFPSIQTNKLSHCRTIRWTSLSCFQVINGRHWYLNSICILFVWSRTATKYFLYKELHILLDLRFLLCPLFLQWFVFKLGGNIRDYWGRT